MELAWQWTRSNLSWRRVLLAALLALAMTIAVPPVRRGATRLVSRVALFALSPFAPGTGGFHDLPAPTRVVAADGTPLASLGGAPRRALELERLPKHVSRAVLAAEDADFYHHSGVDPEAVFRALLNNARGNQVQGGSTITQQLAKLNYTDGRRTAFRKLRELLYAVRLEQRYSKDELFERYLNQVYFGDDAYGLSAASQTFFGLPPDRLSAAQAATLAGKIRAPEGLDPRRHPKRVSARRNQVLGNMAKHGWLTRAELRRAEAEPLRVLAEAPPGERARAAHFVAFATREAGSIDALGATAEARRNRLFTGGLTVVTTLDVKAYDAAVLAAQAELNDPADPDVAVVSVVPGDGAVRVLYGGRDPDREFDLASQGQRQPGSSFKPFVYLAALRAGIDPRTRMDGRSPKTVACNGEPWTVRNFDGAAHGRITMDDATVDSVNAVYAQVMAEVGPRSVALMAERLGIDPEEVKDPQCAMALGGLRHGVRPIEQAAAFATFAARGVYAKPYSIARIIDRHDHVVYQHPFATQNRIDATEAGVLTAALERVVREGTGRAAEIGRPVAGKTGTTEDFGNAWFIGYVPQLATAVWVGHPEGDVPMRDVHGIAVTGGSFPARIFSRYMRQALATTPVEALNTASPDALSLRPFIPTTFASPRPRTSASVTSAPPITASPTTTTSRPPRPTTTAPPAPSTTTTPTPTTAPASAASG
jgi:penicillin-binding protein 1A